MKGTQKACQKRELFIFLLGLQITPSGYIESRVQAVYWPNGCPACKAAAVE